MKSPLKATPLRNPGQSLDEKIGDTIFDFGGYLLASGIVVYLALMEWYRLYSNPPPRPIILTILAFIVVAFTSYKFIKARREIKNLRLGRDGEKTVGEILDKLREKGAKVFHDIPAKGFNLDHVVISTNGIYVVETKTRSKPMMKGRPEIKFNGKSIFQNGFQLDPNPIEQVKGAAIWLKTKLKERTGKNFYVRPVILFPGWWVNSVEANNSEVWVLNPDQLPHKLENSNHQYKNEDVELVSTHLSQYVKTYTE